MFRSRGNAASFLALKAQHLSLTCFVVSLFDISNFAQRFPSPRFDGSFLSNALFVPITRVMSRDTELQCDCELFQRRSTNLLRKFLLTRHTKVTKSLSFFFFRIAISKRDTKCTFELILRGEIL